jgi:hypothetical protein
MALHSRTRIPNVIENSGSGLDSYRCDFRRKDFVEVLHEKMIQADPSSTMFITPSARRVSTGALGAEREFTGHRSDGSGLIFMQGATLQPGSIALRGASLTVYANFNGRPYAAELSRFTWPDSVSPAVLW